MSFPDPCINAILAQPDKWRSLLDQFEDVLKINIFIIDSDGRVMVGLSEKGKAGQAGAAILKKTFEFNAAAGESIVLANFKPINHLQAVIDPFEHFVYAVPVSPQKDKVHFYLVMGPFGPEKLWPAEKITALARQLSLNEAEFLKDVDAVPRMSNPAVHVIADLLAEVVKNVMGLELEQQKLKVLQNGAENVRPEIISEVKDIFAAIQQDELLITVLDSAITMANAEGGSIMVLDEEKQEFVIRVSRGLDNKKNILQAKVKIGEGIAGLAAKEKIPLFIKGTEGDVNLRPFLKRPEIKQSIVIPLVVDEKVIGVLNLRTKNENNNSALETIARDVRQLSRFIATALKSV